jgi:hypothetical protein
MRLYTHADGDRALVSQSDSPAGITRRRLLAGGGVAGAGALVALNPQIAKAADALSTFGEPAYLRRSSYVQLLGTDFTATSPKRVTFALGSVGDLGAAANVKRLRGRDDAFSLVFYGPPGLGAGTRHFSHPFLGAFDLFLSPVDPPAGGQAAYEAIIDRSVGIKGKPRPTKKPPKPKPHRKHPRRRRSRGHKKPR